MRLLALCAGVAVLAAPAFGLRPQSKDLPYSELGQELLKELGQGEVEPGSLDMPALLSASCVYVPLGLFDVYMLATDAADGSNAEDLHSIATELLRLQERWLELCEDVAVDARKAQADLATVAKWVKSWRSGAVAQAAAGGGADLLEALGANEKTVEAAGRFAEYMGLGHSVALQRDEPVREPIILIPDRRRFVQFVCLGAWIRPDLEQAFWQPGIINWTNCYADQYKFMSLRFAAPGHGEGDFSGMGMNEKTPNGMEQQIVQLSANSLIDNHLGKAVPPAFAGGLAVNLVIDLFGECNTRVDGDLSERRTEAVEIFIPGGNPSGGFLPVNSAESRWRTGQGADRFVGMLKTSQKNAGSDARKQSEKLLYFQLMDDEQAKRIRLAAPFLGSAAIGTVAPSEEFHGDYTEFLRAYRAAFVYWLQTSAAGSSKKSALSFAVFLATVAKAKDASELETVLEEAYDGVPLSAAVPTKDVLEGRFLLWLSKQK